MSKVIRELRSLFFLSAVKGQPSRGRHLSCCVKPNAAPPPPTCQMREEDLSQMKHEAAKQTRLKETNQRKLRQMEEQKADMETQKEMLKAQISALEKGGGDVSSWCFFILCFYAHVDANFHVSSSPDLETSQKLVENEKKCIEELIRERDALSKVRTRSAPLSPFFSFLKFDIFHFLFFAFFEANEAPIGKKVHGLVSL